MSSNPLIPAREDVLVLIDSLEILSDRIQDEIDQAEELYYASENPSVETSLDLVMLSAHLEQVALVRGRMQPYLESIMNEEPVSRFQY